MTESIHGHEVLHFMLTQKEGFSKETLIDAIKTKFGAESTFHTCSADGMDAEMLVEFLDMKGKFTSQAPQGFNTEATNICNH